VSNNNTSVRTYGGWRKPVSPGLMGMGLAPSLLLFAGLPTTLFLGVRAGWTAAAVLFLVLVLVGSPMVFKNRAGRTGWQILGSRFAWTFGKWGGSNVYRSGLAGSVVRGEHRLPGLLASTQAVDIASAMGERAAMLHIKRRSHFSVCIALEPEGVQLVDRATVDTRVDEWARFLTNLGYEPGLVGATAVFDISPDPGTRLGAEVARITRDDAPEFAKAMMAEAAATYPVGGAQTHAHVALTYSGQAKVSSEGEGLLGRRRSVDEATVSREPGEMAVEIGRRLGELRAELRASGARWTRLMTVDDAAEFVRGAYDPESAEKIAVLRAGGGEPDVAWSDAGPTAAVESWSSYRHDSGLSVVWEMVDVPKSAVTADVLKALLAPHPDVARKRVALTYRPLDPAESATVVDRSLRTAISRTGRRRGLAYAADTQDLAQAKRMASEEAAGAGVTRLSMIVTATVQDPAKLPAAVRAVEQTALGSRIRLRRMYAGQAAGFAAGLGMGVVLPAWGNPALAWLRTNS